MTDQVDLHENIDREGVIVELLPEGRKHPQEADMSHLTPEQAARLHGLLHDYLTDTDVETPEHD